MMYVTSYALPTELPPPPLMPPPPPWAPMATASHLPGRGWQGGGGGSTSDRGGSSSSSRGMRATAGEQLEPRAGDSGSRIYEEHEERGQPPWKKFVYVEPPRRVKEVLEEELYFRRDECRIKHPSEVALEGIWSLKRNFPVGGFKLASQNESTLLSQPKYYSRHAIIRR